MKTIIVLLLLLVTSVSGICQPSQKISLDNNKVSSKEVSPELQQIFPDFRDGSIYYKNNLPIKCKLNYNFLLDEILFINEKGEKMAIANPQDLSYVLITDRMFIPSEKGYFEVIENGNVSLVYKWICRISKISKKGALGLSTDAPSVYQLNRFSFDAKEWKMGISEEAVASVEVQPYLRTDSKFVNLKGVQSFNKAFHDKKSEIKTYLEQNTVDFKKEADLRMMTRYCNTLK